MRRKPLTVVGTLSVGLAGLSASSVYSIDRDPPTGSCCANSGEWECIADHVTEAECFELPGAMWWAEGQTCGSECPCPSCFVDEDCQDQDRCTDNDCTELFCCWTLPNYDPQTECCHRWTGARGPLGDGDPCTDDICDSDTGQVSHDPIPGQACTDHDDCTPGLCVDQVCVCAANEACCLPDGTCHYIPASLCEEQDGHVVAACAGDNDGDGRDDMCAAIPTLPEWGVLAMMLLMLTAGTLVFLRRRIARA